MSKRKTPESHVLSDVLRELQRRRWLHYRMNTGCLKDANGRPVSFGSPGMADILAFPRVRLTKDSRMETSVSHPLWIECKSINGTQSHLQREFQTTVKAEGHTYIVVHSLDEFMGWAVVLEKAAL